MNSVCHSVWALGDEQPAPAMSAEKAGLALQQLLHSPSLAKLPCRPQLGLNMFRDMQLL